MLKDGLVWADSTAGILLASLFFRNGCRSKTAEDVKSKRSFESFDMIWRRGNQNSVYIITTDLSNLNSMLCGSVILSRAPNHLFAIEHY
jgi:hypothetical protein